LGKQVHCVGIVTGLDCYLCVVSSIIQMYSCCGNDVVSARKMFDDDDGFGKNGSVWNAMIAAYAKVGDVCNARKLFDKMPQMDKDVFSWTTLISCYTQVILELFCSIGTLVNWKWNLGCWNILHSCN
jgi:pentatricopeptide repeat protein